MISVIASDFLAASILTLVLPVTLLTIVGLYWWFVLGRTDLHEELDEGVTDPDAR